MYTSPFFSHFQMLIMGTAWPGWGPFFVDREWMRIRIDTCTFYACTQRNDCVATGRKLQWCCAYEKQAIKKGGGIQKLLCNSIQVLEPEHTHYNWFQGMIEHVDAAKGPQKAAYAKNQACNLGPSWSFWQKSAANTTFWLHQLFVVFSLFVTCPNAWS